MRLNGWLVKMCAYSGACPGHPRLETLATKKKDVDARDERGHDELIV
jgi:hypothetical protein